MTRFMKILCKYSRLSCKIVAKSNVTLFFCFSIYQSYARIEPDVHMVDKHWTQFSIWRGGRSGTPLLAFADSRTRGAYTSAQH